MTNVILLRVEAPLDFLQSNGKKKESMPMSAEEYLHLDNLPAKKKIAIQNIIERTIQTSSYLHTKKGLRHHDNYEVKRFFECHGV
jgi:hypothetical protein